MNNPVLIGPRSQSVYDALRNKVIQLREQSVAAEALGASAPKAKDLPFSARSHEFGDLVIAVQSEASSSGGSADEASRRRKTVIVSVEVARESSLDDGVVVMDAVIQHHNVGLEGRKHALERVCCCVLRHTLAAPCRTAGCT